MAGLKTFFQQLLGGKQIEKPAEKAVEPEILGTDVETLPVEPPHTKEQLHSGTFALGWLTDVGRVRGHNEDALFVFMGEQNASDATLPFALLMLADGMGGHQAGEVASSLSLRVAAHHLISQVYAPLLSGSSGDLSLHEIVSEAVSKANRLITQDVPGSGCTLTCGLILGQRIFIGHVGDSRAYLLRQGEPLKCLTKDHSLVSRLKEMGQLTEEEAAVHPQRNVLTRAIGQGDSLEVDVTTHKLQPGDRLLLCSDGLWTMMEESDITRTIEESASPAQACVRLVGAANAAGGNDNITVVLAEVCQDEE
ncbi:MAG: serine/threonine-protein phosphatase [Anaerolineae bacterium]|nr:serine/threonine-protein phosphatase [Anaerolineae bacterium]